MTAQLAPALDDVGRRHALRWIGIDVTGGVEYTRWNLGIEDEIVTELSVDGTMNSARLILDSTATFDLTSTAFTIPVEVSTGIRIAMLVSVYVGAAVDLTAGTGKLAADLTGTLFTSDGREVGTSTVTGGGDSSASPLAARVLAGAQLNLWKLKVYAQINASATPAASVGFGIRGVL